MSQHAIIYALLDPESDDVKYIGKTVRYLSQRYALHIWLANKSKDKSKDKKTQWMKSMLNCKKRPKIKIIEKVSLEQGDEREQFWIKHYKEMGAVLVNSTNGGRGIAGFRHTEEAKIRIREASKIKIFSDEYKNKLSITKVGKLNPQCKLNYDDIQMIKELLMKGMRQRKIANLFNIDPSHISKIKTGAYLKRCLNTMYKEKYHAA